MPKRNWISYEPLRSGRCEALWDCESWEGRYEIGRYYSGKSRVYEGLYTLVEGQDGRKWMGHDRWCPVDALRNLFVEMQADGLTLICAGLDKSFYTTGLSDGTGFGYLRSAEDRGAFHIFDSIDPSRNE